jgi:hypothetical protein
MVEISQNFVAFSEYINFTIVLILYISTMVNGTLLNFDKRYEDDLGVIFDQWPILHLGLDALSNLKILKGIKDILSNIGMNCPYYIPL